MGKYYLYNGKQVGYVRKAIDEVVLVEEGWVSEVQNHFGKRTHDELLAIPATIMKNAGFPPVSRAQSWIILLQILNKGVPEALRDIDADEKIGKGSILKDIAKSTARVGATVVDTTAAATGAVVGAAASVVTTTADVAEDVVDGAADIVEDAVDVVTGDEDEAGADGEGSE
jgi:hypothetical protein